MAVPAEGLTVVLAPDEIHLLGTFLGSCRLVAALNKNALAVNRKRLLSLLRVMGNEHRPTPTGCGLIDVHGRWLLARRLSKNTNVHFCLEAMEKVLGAFREAGDDQGSRFTSQGLTRVVEPQGIEISLDEKAIWCYMV